MEKTYSKSNEDGWLDHNIPEKPNGDSDDN